MARVYLDACKVIYGIEDKGALGDAVHALMAENIETAAYFVSDLVRFEVMCGSSVATDAQLRKSYDGALSEAETLQLSRGVFELAAKLRVDHKLKALDAIHLAAAVHHACEEFWTNDQKMLSIAQIEKTRIRRIS